MLCDWLSLRLDLRSDADLALLDALSRDRDVCHRLKGGELVTAWWPRESVRTDTHRITVGLSLGAISIEGSPARLMGPSNVFGSPDPSACAEAMLKAVAKASGVILPPLARWRATRIDLTQNYDCGAHVSEALDSLRNVCGGHLRVSSRNNGCYWNEGSDLWSAVAYMKGPHLERQCRKGLVSEPPEHIALAAQLLRIEIRLRNHYLKRAGIEISRFNTEAAMAVYQLHASKLIPERAAQITSDQQLADYIVNTYGPRRGRALLGTWGLIQALGEEGARSRVSKATWHRHVKELFALGLGRADLAARKVVAFRPRLITARPVDSWNEIRRAA